MERSVLPRSLGRLAVAAARNGFVLPVAFLLSGSVVAQKKPPDPADPSNDSDADDARKSNL